MSVCCAMLRMTQNDDQSVVEGGIKLCVWIPPTTNWSTLCVYICAR